MSETITKWIWQHPKYPDFNYDKTLITDLISEIDYHRGILDGMSKLFNEDDIKRIEIDTLTDEAINTSLIEGEVFKRESVRSSFRKKLDKDFDGRADKYSTAATDSLVEILLDCSLNKEALTIERLNGWHNCLFENSYNRLSKINIAKFRDHDDMEVVSGAIGFEKVHYKAVPISTLNDDMKNFLDYCNTSKENIYIKSAIAHLWFVSIHPYDDGNGRVSRAITDYILSQQTLNTQFKLYSISTAINNDRKGYYDILDKTTNLFLNKTFDITPWLLWNLTILKNSMIGALKNIDYIIQKTKFWDVYRMKPLNERQIKVLNRILDIGSENFEGGINTKKYISLTKVSKATAVRDITQLVEYGCIIQIEGTSGRNIRYSINI
ncbi:Fic family protein [bacterium]|mgnify:CR=1 FL=1|nr:Fic family protein [bacterium]MBT4632997.1 Fic family protein [bacterium]